MAANAFVRPLWQVGVFFVPRLLWRVTSVFGVSPERPPQWNLPWTLSRGTYRTLSNPGPQGRQINVKKKYLSWKLFRVDLFFKLKMNSSLFYFTTTKNNEPFPIYCSGLINTTICICRGGRRVCIGLGPRRFAPIHSPPGLARCPLGPVRSVRSGNPLEHYW